MLTPESCTPREQSVCDKGWTKKWETVRLQGSWAWGGGRGLSGVCGSGLASLGPQVMPYSQPCRLLAETRVPPCEDMAGVKPAA